MKKIIALLSVAIIAMSSAFQAKAIEDPWEKGTIVAGAMFGYYPGIGGALTGDYVLVDSWWMGHFTVGAQVNFRYWAISPNYSYNDFALAPRATYGLNITDKFEVHAGAMAGLGFRKWVYVSTYSEEVDRNHQFGMCVGGLAGVRYFFTPNFGIAAEFNYSDYGPFSNVGVTFKF